MPRAELVTMQEINQAMQEEEQDKQFQSPTSDEDSCLLEDNAVAFVKSMQSKKGSRQASKPKEEAPSSKSVASMSTGNVK